MWINGKVLDEYSGKLLMDYKVGSYELDVEIFKGRNRSSFNLLSMSTGLKTLVVPIMFNGTNRAELYRKKSMFEQDIFGKSELIMDDGLMYSVVLSNMGEVTYIGEELAKVEYTFVGFNHGEYVKAIGNSVYCDSTLPHTDCILTVTVTNDGVDYKVGSVTFKSVVSGEILTVDGINGCILVNGVPAAERADWIEFPKLVPGINQIQCIDIPTVEFYPVYF